MLTLKHENLNAKFRGPLEFFGYPQKGHRPPGIAKQVIDCEKPLTFTSDVEIGYCV